MGFKIGDHLQEIGSNVNGIVIREITDSDINGKRWYLIKNDELGLVNHWVPEHMLESYKKTLREGKLKELGI
jgi:hypothetical protein